MLLLILQYAYRIFLLLYLISNKIYLTLFFKRESINSDYFKNILKDM